VSGGYHYANATYQNNRQEQEVDLRVKQSLDNLFDLEMSVAHARLIDAHVVQECNLFRLRQPMSFHRRVREEEDHAKADNYRDAPESHEHGPPPCKRRAGLDVLEAIRHSAADDLAQAKT
jgi:hypothetical protein